MGRRRKYNNKGGGSGGGRSNESSLHFSKDNRELLLGLQRKKGRVWWGI